MIEWKTVDRYNPPKGKYLFIFDGIIYEGWIFDRLDEQGYPYWQANEGPECYDVRWYADINYPE